MAMLQPDRLLFRIEQDVKEIQSDNLNNLYVITRTNQLLKYDADGQLRSTLNYAYQGNLAQLDATNPLEPYVLYRELNRVVFLDNNLAYRGMLNLTDAGISQAAAIARSYSGGVWVFDQGDMKLKKLAKDCTLLQESGNILQLAPGGSLQPREIRDDGNRVFMLDSTAGIMIFDVFANHLKTIATGGATHFSSVGQELFYSQGQQLVRYHLQTLRRDTIDFPGQGNVTHFHLSADRLYLQRNGATEAWTRN